jgi:hypothetical protein
MEIPSHSGHEAPSQRAESNAPSPHLWITMSVRALLLAFMCTSGGCATTLPHIQNSGAHHGNSTEISGRPSKGGGKPAPKPVNNSKKIQNDSQENNESGKATPPPPPPPPPHYEEPQDDRNTPCDEIDLNDPGACVEV